MADQAGQNTVLYTTSAIVVAGTAVIGTVTVQQAGNVWQVIPGSANSTAGSVGPVSTTTATTIIGAASGSTLFITSMQVGNTGTVAATAKLSDAATTIFAIPASGFWPIVFATPLQTQVGSALTITLGTVSTSIFVSAQGHY